MEFCGLFAIMKTLLLLIVSFFILVAVSKVESQKLKKFGRILAIVLWVIAGCVIVCTFYLSVTGNYRSFAPHSFHKYKMMKCW